MTSNQVANGSDALLFLDKKRTYFIRVRSGESFHTHKGFIRFDDIIGRAYGSRVRSSLGEEFAVLKPSLRDFIQKISRRTQIIYPKDMALIMLYADIRPGSRIVEAGTGSGALTVLLADRVRPDGRVFTYEVREEFLDIARRNVERMRLSSFVEFKNKSIMEGVEEEDVDAVVLDLATPWEVVPFASKALRGSGYFASFSPTIEQTIKTCVAMEKEGFVAVETVECLVRRFQVKEGMTRPETLMTGHTGYLTFGRKILTD